MLNVINKIVVLNYQKVCGICVFGIQVFVLVVYDEMAEMCTNDSII